MPPPKYGMEWNADLAQYVPTESSMQVGGLRSMRNDCLKRGPWKFSWTYKLAQVLLLVLYVFVAPYLWLLYSMATGKLAAGLLDQRGWRRRPTTTSTAAGRTRS